MYFGVDLQNMNHGYKYSKNRGTLDKGDIIAMCKGDNMAYRDVCYWNMLNIMTGDLCWLAWYFSWTPMKECCLWRLKPKRTIVQSDNISLTNLRDGFVWISASFISIIISRDYCRACSKAWTRFVKFGTMQLNPHWWYLNLEDNYAFE